MTQGRVVSSFMEISRWESLRKKSSLVWSAQWWGEFQGEWGLLVGSWASSWVSPCLEQVGGWYLPGACFVMSSNLGSCIKCYQCSSTEDRRGTPDGVWSKDPYSQDRSVSPFPLNLSQLASQSESCLSIQQCHERSEKWSWSCSGLKTAVGCTTPSRRRETSQ